MKRIELYTDGSCIADTRSGGWAYVLKYGDALKPNAGETFDTTNNRMELFAVIMGLRAIKNTKIPVTVISDSKYIVNAFNQDWIGNWIKKGWRNSRNKQVANKDLWQCLHDELKRFQDIKFQWVKGHNGNRWNEWADEMAYEGAQIARQYQTQALSTA
jgi:ribonuclease HI